MPSKRPYCLAYRSHFECKGALHDPEKLWLGTGNGADGKVGQQYSMCCTGVFDGYVAQHVGAMVKELGPFAGIDINVNDDLMNDAISIAAEVYEQTQFEPLMDAVIAQGERTGQELELELELELERASL